MSKPKLSIVIPCFNAEKYHIKSNIDKKEFEYFLVKTLCFYLLYPIRNESIKSIRSERKKIVNFLNEKMPEWRKKVKLLSPRGENFPVRIIVFFFTKIWSRI